MFLLTEGEDRFYQVSIHYSPQTESSLMVWNELQDMAQLFRVLRTPERAAIGSLPSPANNVLSGGSVEAV
jgi:hypothetical protein